MKALKFPLVRITLFFVLGILTAFFLKPNLSYILLVLFFATATFFWSYFKNKYFGVFCFILSFFIGISAQVFHTNSLGNNHYIKQIDDTQKPHVLEVTLNEKLKNTFQNTRFVATVNRFDTKESCGKIILNIRKDSVCHDFEIGLNLKIQASVYKNRAINNPNQFDYGQYLDNQQIYAQVYADLNEIKTSTFYKKDIWYYASKFRNKIIHNLEKNGFGKSELAVIVALILGQQQDISPDVLQDYQLAGAIHILSVSGLHVGFIMFFLGYLLKPISNTKTGKIIKLIITILSLWSFGFIAGLAPSILRSVVMFSIVAVGKHTQRGMNFFHTLFVSAFIILLFKPSFLFDVGFQLSYISLFFIVWLQPLLEKIWTPRNWFLNKMWEIITVSFAAQIGAFPLSIYYFHQFPGLFFITNLIVLPIIGFIMAYGVLIMLLAFFDFVPQLPMKILENSISFLDKIIAYIASFEQFIIQNIPLNFYILLSLYGVIFAVIIWFKKPDFNKLILAFTSIIIFQTTCLITKNYHQKQQELIVFNLKNTSLIINRNGQKATVFVNDSVLKNIDKNIHLKSYLTGNFSGIYKKEKISNLLSFNNKKILILDSIPIYPSNFKPDIVLITQSPKLNLERFLQTCRPKIVVADASNFKSYLKFWKATCQQQKIPFHTTTEKGFFRLK